MKYLGLSEVAPQDVRRAHAIHPITLVEMWVAQHPCKLAPSADVYLLSCVCCILVYYTTHRGEESMAFSAQAARKPERSAPPEAGVRNGRYCDVFHSDS